jgi:hypothetical protein
VVQVLETSERAMQVRILVSAQDAGRTFDLRCKIREGLLAFVHKNYPDCLPRIRGESVNAIVKADGEP